MEIAWLGKQLAKQCRRAEEAEERAEREAALKRQARQGRAAAIKTAVQAGQRAETLHTRLEATKGDVANLTARLANLTARRSDVRAPYKTRAALGLILLLSSTLW